MLKQLAYKLKSFLPNKAKKAFKNNAVVEAPLSLDSFVELLAHSYENKSGFICEIDREDASLGRNNIFLTYGEILPQGLARLFDFIQPTANDVFVDLGSGAGKTTLQSYLCTNMKASLGVEVDGARYGLAQEVLSNLKISRPALFKNHKYIEFINSNLMDFDCSGISIIFANSTCFGGNLMAYIIDQINSSPDVRAVMSTKKIEGLVNLPFEEIVQIETSWHIPPDTSNCYVYYR